MLVLWLVLLLLLCMWVVLQRIRQTVGEIADCLAHNGRPRSPPARVRGGGYVSD